MQTIWDLLPASLWPTKPFIPPDQAARTMQMWQALQASGNSSPPGAFWADNRVGPPWTQMPSPVGPVGGEHLSSTSADADPPSDTHGEAADTDTQGGILGAIFGEAPERDAPPQFTLAGAANDNNPGNAQCTTASYDCLGHATNGTYMDACNKAYFLCLFGGQVARERGVHSIVNFPDGGSVVLYPDGRSRYTPTRSVPKGLGD
jgi:hypothetical protein